MNKQAQNEEFYKLYKWMVADLHLSGNDLVVYSIIHSFCERGNLYVGSREFLAHEAGATKRTIDYTLKRLLDMGMIEKVEFGFKCVKQPLTMCAKIAQNSANFTSDCAKIAHNKIKDKKINIECSNSVIDSEPTHTSTPTLDFLFQSFKSKIANEMDESCIRNLAKKFANIEQAKLFAEFCEERKTTLNLGMICKLHGEIFDKACEWDAQGRPRKHQNQPKIAHQPQVQMLPPQETSENSAKEADRRNFNQWRNQVIDCIKNNPKFAKKTLMQMMRITTQVTDLFPTPCELEKINEYLNAI